MFDVDLDIHVGDSGKEREVRLTHQCSGVEVLAGQIREGDISNKACLCGVDLVEEVADSAFDDVFNHCRQSREETDEVGDLRLHLDERTNALLQDALDLFLERLQ